LSYVDESATAAWKNFDEAERHNSLKEQTVVFTDTRASA
jgi:hypothetical protein